MSRLYVGDAGDEWGGGGKPAQGGGGGGGGSAAPDPGLQLQQGISLLLIKAQDLSAKTGGGSAELETLVAKLTALQAAAIAYSQNGVGDYDWIKSEFYADSASFDDIASRAVDNPAAQPTAHATPAGTVVVPPKPNAPPAAIAAAPKTTWKNYAPYALAGAAAVGLGAVALLGGGAAALRAVRR